MQNCILCIHNRIHLNIEDTLQLSHKLTHRYRLQRINLHIHISNDVKIMCTKITANIKYILHSLMQFYCVVSQFCILLNFNLHSSLARDTYTFDARLKYSEFIRNRKLCSININTYTYMNLK